VADPHVDDDLSRRSAWIEIARTWVPAIAAVLLIRTFVFEPFRIPSGSMVPTLEIGDQVVISKMAYGTWVPFTGVEVPFMDQVWLVPRVELWDRADPERGDIIVFRYPKNEKQHYIKRVAAIPGDRLRVKDNQIILSGEAQKREYLERYDVTTADCRSDVAKRWSENLGGLEHEVLTNAGLPGSLSTFPKGTEEVVVPEGHVFVMGDNRDNSEDSRRWGLVRHDQIKGKAKFVWFSWDSCNVRPRASRWFRGLYEAPS